LKWSTKVATCATIRLYSTTFDTESPYDYIKIEGTEYSGNTSIDVEIAKDQTVYFHSDDSVTKSGFVLKWACGTYTNYVNSLEFFI